MKAGCQCSFTDTAEKFAKVSPIAKGCCNTNQSNFDQNTACLTHPRNAEFILIPYVNILDSDLNIVDDLVE